MTSSGCSSPEHHHHYENSTSSAKQHAKKKRVGKACDSCRLKKTKCSGKQPCEKCQADNKICIYTERKKSRDKVYSYEYVELIEKRLNLLNKSLIELSKMVKLQKNDDLLNYADNLDYNEYDENTPISINQAISLLLDKQDTSDTNSNSNLAPLSEQGVLSSEETMNSASFDTSIQQQDPTITRKKRSSRQRKENPSATLSTNYNVVVSSPESLTPKSDELSPLQNATSNDTNSDSIFSSNSRKQLLQLQRQQSHSQQATVQLQQTANDGLLDNIKEEENDSAMNQFGGEPFLAGNNAIKTEDDVSIMGFNSLDLGPFQSGAQIATAAMNGLFNGINPSTTNNSNNNGSYSPASTVTGLAMSDLDFNLNNSSCTSNIGSPVSANFQRSSLDGLSSPHLMTLGNGSVTSTNNNNFLNGDSNFDTNGGAISPPMSLNENNSAPLGRSYSISQRHTSLHGHTNHSYSNHPHPYRTNSITRTKSNSTIGSVPMDNISITSPANDEFPIYF